MDALAILMGLCLLATLVAVSAAAFVAVIGALLCYQWTQKVKAEADELIAGFQKESQALMQHWLEKQGEEDDDYAPPHRQEDPEEVERWRHHQI